MTMHADGGVVGRLVFVSLDGKFVDCNCAFSIISGFSNDEILKRSVFDLTPPEDCQELMRWVGTNDHDSVRHTEDNTGR
jgi:PAS domain S-box-containing protein